MQDLISVVIPNYGHRHYLMDSVQSILNQTWQDFEIFILNDDEQSLMEYEKLDKRIRVFDRVDGVRHTSEWRLNNIVDELSDYWAYQDADGTSYPGRLMRSYEFLNVSDSDIIWNDGVCVYPDNKIKYLNSKKFDCLSSVMAKKKVLQSVKFTTKRQYGSDLIWFNEIVKNNFNFSHLGMPLYKKYSNTSTIKKFNGVFILGKVWRIWQQTRLKRNFDL